MTIYDTLRRAHAGEAEDDINPERAAWADAAVQAFASATGLVLPENYAEAIKDLACDLLHLAEQRALDPTWVLAFAARAYAHETVSERPSVANIAARQLLIEACDRIKIGKWDVAREGEE